MTVVNPSDLIADRAAKGLTLLLCHPGVAEEQITVEFGARGFRKSEPCIYLSTRLPAEGIRKSWSMITGSNTGLKVVDGFGWRTGAFKGDIHLKSLGELNVISRTLKSAAPNSTPYRLVVDSFSDIMLEREIEACLMLYKDLAAFLKETGGRGLFAVSAGTHPDWVEVYLQAWADVMIEVKLERSNGRFNTIARISKARDIQSNPSWINFKPTPEGFKPRQPEKMLSEERKFDELQHLFRYVTLKEALEIGVNQLKAGSSLTALIASGIERKPQKLLPELFKSARDAVMNGASVRLMFSVTDSNLEVVKTLLRLGIEVRHVKPGLNQILILVDEGVIDFAFMGKSGIYSTHKPIVEQVATYLESVWAEAQKAEDRLQELEKGVESKVTKIFGEGEEAYKFFRKCTDSARHTLFFTTTEMGLERIVRGYSYKELADRGIKLRGLAPITNRNIELARLLSRYGDLRHMENNTIRIAIVDDERVFMFQAMPEGPDPESGFQNMFYSNEEQYIDAFKRMTETLWKRGISAKRWLKVLDAVEKITSTISPDQLFNDLARISSELTDSEIGMAANYDKRTRSFSTPILYTLPTGMIRDKTSTDSINRAIKIFYDELLSGETVTLANLSGHRDFNGRQLGALPLKSLLGVPIINPVNEVVGFLAAGNKKGGRQYSRSNKKILTFLAQKAAIRIQLLIEEFQKFFPSLGSK